MTRSVDEAKLRAENDLKRARMFGRGGDVATMTESQRLRDVADLERVGLSKEAAQRGADGLQRGSYGSLREAAAMASTFGSEASPSRVLPGMLQVVESERATALPSDLSEASEDALEAALKPIQAQEAELRAALKKLRSGSNGASVTETQRRSEVRG